MTSFRAPFRLLAAVLLTAAAIATSGCGSDDDSGGELLVSAATSLKTAFTSYGEQFDAADVQFSFAGSDELAAQIRSGAKPDVFASANTKLPDALFADGLVEKPQVFASNRLVLAVPAGATKVRSLDDLSASGVSIAIGSPSVPIGAYTRKVLGRLDGRQRAAILANVRSNEPDVGGVELLAVARERGLQRGRGGDDDLAAVAAVRAAAGDGERRGEEGGGGEAGGAAVAVHAPKHHIGMPAGEHRPAPA